MTLHPSTRHASQRESEVYKAVNRAVANLRLPQVPEHQPDAQDLAAANPAPRALNLAEMLMHKFPEREPILAPWLLTQSLNMIYAWRGTGKTHVALGIAYAIATGGQFLTWVAAKARRVLYLDGEMPGAAMQERLRALVDADERDFDPGFLQIVTPDAQYGAMPDLATADGQLAIDLSAETHDCEVIIVDNISTLCRDTGAENEAESWRAVQGWALRQRQAGRAVVFIHHSGKDGRQRGTSKREDTLDCVLRLSQPTDYTPDQGARFEVHFEKYRPRPGADDARPIEAMLSTDGNGKPVWTWRPVEESTYLRVVALANDGLTAGEIASELDVNKSTVSRHLKHGRAEGLLKGAKP